MNTTTNLADEPATAGHTISVVAERTGLSRDVLRVWERRYRAVEPARTAGGQRLYSDEQMQRFVLLAEATRQGRSIGSVAALDTEALARIVSEDKSARRHNDAIIEPTDSKLANFAAGRAVADLALARALALDSAGLDAELRRALTRNGLPFLLEAVIPALMHRIGDEWVAGRLSVAHEHLASAVVLTILLESIRAVPESAKAPRVLVATPAGEQHVVGAALIAAALALDGWNIRFLGANVPASDLLVAANGVNAVALSMVNVTEAPQTVRELRVIRSALDPSVPLFVGGAAAQGLRDELSQLGIHVCSDLSSARSALALVARGKLA